LYSQQTNRAAQHDMQPQCMQQRAHLLIYTLWSPRTSKRLSLADHARCQGMGAWGSSSGGLCGKYVPAAHAVTAHHKRKHESTVSTHAWAGNHKVSNAGLLTGGKCGYMAGGCRMQARGRPNFTASEVRGHMSFCLAGRYHSDHC
jgi:hypothetical protein